MEDKTKTLAELAAMVDGEVHGDPRIAISGLNDLDEATASEITFITKAGRAEAIENTRAAAVIVPLAVHSASKPLLRVKDPNVAAAVIHGYFESRPFEAAGISDQAVIGTDCAIPDQISISARAVLGNRVRLGERVTIHAGVVIGDRVTIGDDCILYPNVIVYPESRIGNRVLIHSGSVIGSDGYGYATDKNGRHLKRPHVGFVQIDDDVEIGANVCVDRGTFGRTWIKQGVKIDNLVQVAHNVVIGEGSLVVAQVGLAGSSSLGRGVVIGGQAGIKGHVHLEDGVMVAAQSGVHNNQPAGAIVSGTPAIPHKDWLKSSSILAKLPELYREIRELKKQLAALQAKGNGPKGQRPHRKKTAGKRGGKNEE
ncbi:MAG: UDP-3-O-(3-hydroxymyristoyl)glucosamine N-acyltransferase [Pseudomonadota bacterium]